MSKFEEMTTYVNSVKSVSEQADKFFSVDFAHLQSLLKIGSSAESSWNLTLDNDGSAFLIVFGFGDNFVELKG